MIILCPKCKIKNLKVGERKPVSRSLLYPNRIVDGEFLISNNKEIFIRICSCDCGFKGYTMEVEIINLLEFKE